jgi:hypothetical protein
MRTFVYLLALLAVVKIVYSEYVFRTTVGDAVIAAYRGEASEACGRDSRSLGLAVAPDAWQRASDIRIVVGNTDVTAMPWQIGTPEWRARYRNVHLRLAVEATRREVVCDYDIVSRSATVEKT